MDSESENLRRIINNLPEDIILEILPKLPVKSLLRFKCVSKSWCSLISSEHFIKTHLDNSKKDPTFAHHKIISAFPKPNCRLKRHSLLSRSSSNDQVIRLSYDGNSIEKLTYPSSNIYAVRIVGSCNGLICLFLPENNFQLWNPSTGEHKILPTDYTKGGDYTKFGFGFDEISGDYKVYAVFSWPFGDDYYANIARVYSLKTNSWKSTKHWDVSPYDKKGILVNGKLHWIKPTKFRLKLWDINSFDLTSEAHGIVDQPRNLKGDGILSLGELRGCLCVAVCDRKGEQLDVWIWKEYGVKDSWDKVVSIPYRGYEPWKAAYSTPLYILTNGEILFKYGSTFLVYDRKHDRFSKTPEEVVGITGYYLYVESLVKLNSDRSQQQSQPWKFGTWSIDDL